MNTFEYIRLALRALRTNNIRSILTMLGIIIGVASVILLVSIGSGLQAFVTSQFSSLGSNKIFVFPGETDLKRIGGRPFTPVSKFELGDVGDILRSSDAISEVTPVTVQTGTVSFRGEVASVDVVGAWENYFGIANWVTQRGSIITQNDVERTRKVIVLGSKPAVELFGDTDPIGKTVAIGDIRYQVKGVLVSKGGGGALGNDIDKRVIIPLTTALRQYNQSRPSMLLVEARSQDTVEQAENDVRRTLLKRLKEDDFTILQQKELLSTITQFISVITVALGGIAAISLLVGGIGIMNIMLVSVTERTREIGLRKSVGATGRDILVQFLIESVILSLAGGIIGILLGGAGSLALRAFIQTEVTIWSVLLASGFSALIGIIFGVAPAIRASRLDPIEALRYE
ncbi:ABC transporter permease [Candidatus Gottesmanbacteria bacterium]|nr:ABC transporter permease [Candidatus Gottesmanbacteria bacterium]